MYIPLRRNINMNIRYCSLCLVREYYIPFRNPTIVNIHLKTSFFINILPMELVFSHKKRYFVEEKDKISVSKLNFNSKPIGTNFLPYPLSQGITVWSQ